MRLRTKLFIAWGTLVLLLWAATLWTVEHTMSSNFDHVADAGFSDTRRSLDAVQFQHLKQMRQACWMVMNIPELRALIAEESSELEPSNVDSLTERLDTLSEMIGVNMICVLDSRGSLIAQNRHSPWSSVQNLGEYLSGSTQASALIRGVFTSAVQRRSTSGAPQTNETRSVHGMWVDHQRLYQVVGVPLIFRHGSGDDPIEADGALIMASAVTDVLTAELGKGHNCHITFFADGAATASTLSSSLQTSLQRILQPESRTLGRPFELSLGETAYRSWLQPLYDPCSQTQVGQMLVQISLAHLQMAQARLWAVLALILGSGLVVVALATYFVSSAVTRPVAELVAGVRRVAGGDLDLALRTNRRDELGELGGAFNDMVSKLRTHRDLQRLVEESQAASRAKSQFLANMSHEIRTPLNGVVGLTQLMLTTALDQRQRRYANLIKSSADVLTSLINDILDFSKIEAGKMELESIAMSAHAIVEDVVELMAPRAFKKGLEITCDVGADVPASVFGDPNRLRQILINLVSNAIKFTDSGDIAVHARCESISENQVIVRFSVIDTGIGIVAERQDRLFKSFSQIDPSTTRKHGGTGLGLAISKQLAEMMGGSIGIESQPGQGSTFWFTAQLKVESFSSKSSPENHKLSTMRALVADSHARSSDMAKRRLRELGIDAMVVSNATQLHAALTNAATIHQEFHLVLIADKVAGAAGVELAAIVRGIAGHDRARLILLSKSDHDLDTSTLNSMGFDGCVIKPLTGGKLRDEILAAANTEQASGVHKGAVIVPARDSTSHPAGHRARILLAEDNEVNQLVVIDMLRNAGFDCDVAEDGERAVAAFESDTAYDLILMDCQMPKMDGFEATRLIRQKERAGVRAQRPPRIPIVALTASAVRGDKQKCFDAGMDAYCTKPIDGPELMRVLESILNSRASANTTPSEVHEPDSSTSAHGSATANTAPVDFDTLLRRCSGKTEFAGQVLEALATRISDASARLQQCLDQGDCGALASVAHSIKGAAGMAGADALHQAAAELERLGRAEDVSGLRDRLAGFRGEVNRCHDYICSRRESVSPSTADESRQASKERES